MSRIIEKLYSGALPVDVIVLLGAAIEDAGVSARAIFQSRASSKLPNFVLVMMSLRIHVLVRMPSTMLQRLEATSAVTTHADVLYHRTMTAIRRALFRRQWCRARRGAACGRDTVPRRRATRDNELPAER